MAAPAAALLAIMNLHQNNHQGAGSGRSTRGAASNTSGQAATSGSTDKKNIIAQKYLTDCKSFYSCLNCRAHLANHDELISRSFQGNRSRAYLFNSVINITTGAPVQRELNTGSHAVADIFCSNCGTTVGWKYEKAYVDSQKYKEGKFIIELAHVVRENRHLELDKRDMFLALHLRPHAHLDDSSKQTIGQLHQGSLSPLSNSAESRWSYGTSSASSSSPSQGGDAVGLYEYSGHEQENDHADDDDDEQEVLMFPFHDDLYGERASYSNLSISRLSYRRRNRRSLHLESTPYDWKYLTRPSASSSLEPDCSPSVGQRAAASSSSLPTLAPARQPRAQKSDRQPESAIQSGATLNATKHGQRSKSVVKKQEPRLEESSGDEDDEDEEHQPRDRDQNEIQFELDPCDSSTLSADQNCHQLRATKRTRLEQGSSSTWDCQPGPSGLAKAPQTHEQVEMVARRQASASSPTTSGHVEFESVAPGCLSVDDEEFYDCCTGEHQISNS